MGNILIRSAKVFCAGCCVYFAMAACSSDGGGTTPGASSSGSSGASSGSSGQSSGSPVPNAMADDWYASGSRLKIQFYQAYDGAKSFGGFFDSMRNEKCAIATHADGSSRCMPYSNLASTGSFYREAGCQLPLFNTSKGAPAATYGVKFDAAGTRRYPLTAYTGNIYVGSPASCSDVTTTYSSTYNFYVPGDEVPSSAFVGATLTTAQ